MYYVFFKSNFSVYVYPLCSIFKITTRKFKLNYHQNKFDNIRNKIINFMF